VITVNAKAAKVAEPKRIFSAALASSFGFRANAIKLAGGLEDGHALRRDT
jgi:hypothetical protein